MDWSRVDYLWIIVLFLSAVWTLIMAAPIHCKGSKCFSKPVQMKKQTSKPEGEYISKKYSFLGELLL